MFFPRPLHQTMISPRHIMMVVADILHHPNGRTPRRHFYQTEFYLNRHLNEWRKNKVNPNYATDFSIFRENIRKS